PVYYPNVTEILGVPVLRDLRSIRGKVDIVNVFRRSEDVAEHVDDLIALRPSTVWLQSGIRDDASADKLARAGIQVVQDRCLMVEHRQARG
ncbi:MAG: CoA-binding protein, partial [Polyangiaceae bacterium]|nr:CoA-binding protein [Polyangiaceae bacterium]